MSADDRFEDDERMASPLRRRLLSGLAAWAFGQVGKSVPHYTVATYNAFP